MKKKIVESKKLVVGKETIRALDSRKELVEIAGGRFPYSAASHQDVCCA
jgi:hypothetical protein